jgi:hypothetical protein
MLTRRSTGAPEFDTQVHPTPGVRADRVPSHKHLLQDSLSPREFRVRNVLAPILLGLSAQQSEAFRELFRSVKDSPLYPFSLAVTELLSQLLEKNGRLSKRIRRQERGAEQRLLFAGLLHTVSPEALREIGLGEIADIIGYEDPKTHAQCMLQGAIEYLKIQEQKPTLILLDMIQKGDYDTLHAMILTCLFLDLLDIRTGKLSPEEARAQSIAQKLLTNQSVLSISPD